jgi:hypothetical protein
VSLMLKPADDTRAANNNTANPWLKMLFFIY